MGITKNLPAKCDYFFTCSLFAFLSAVWADKHGRTRKHFRQESTAIPRATNWQLIFLCLFFIICLFARQIVCEKERFPIWVCKESLTLMTLYQLLNIQVSWTIKKPDSNFSPDYKELGHNHTFLLMVHDLAKQKKRLQVQEAENLCSKQTKSVHSQHITTSFRASQMQFQRTEGL